MSRFDISLGVGVGAIAATIAVTAIGLEPVRVATAATVPFVAIGVYRVVLESLSNSEGSDR